MEFVIENDVLKGIIDFPERRLEYTNEPVYDSEGYFPKAVERKRR